SGHAGRGVFAKLVVALGAMELVVMERREADVEARGRELAEERVVIRDELHVMNIGASEQLPRRVPEEPRVHAALETIDLAAEIREEQRGERVGGAARRVHD